MHSMSDKSLNQSTSSQKIHKISPIHAKRAHGREKYIPHCLSPHHPQESGGISD